MQDFKRNRTNLRMAWIDFRRSHYMNPHLWIIECLDSFGIARNVTYFLKRSRMRGKTEQDSSRKILGTLAIRRGAFQGDSLSPLLFVLCMVTLILVLRNPNLGFELKGKSQTISFLVMDDLKLYGRNESQVSSLVH